MKVLFVYIDSQYSGACNTSLGIASLSGYLKKFGHKTALVYYRSKSDTQYLLDKIQKVSPDIIGFYSTSSGYATVRTLSQRTRELYEHIYQIYGGIHATLVPEAIYHTETLDALCFGYGEVPLLAYAEYIASGESNHNIPGLWIRHSLNNSDTIVQNKAYFQDANPDEFLNFDYELFLDELERFPEFNRADYCLEVIFNRGCPFKCAFCSNHKLNEIYGNRKFVPSPEKSVAFLKDALKQTDLSKVEIHDDILTLNKKWFRTFITHYASEIGVPFVCNLRAGTFDEQDIKLLKEANVSMVWFGIESGNNFIRNKVMKKGVSENQIQEAFQLFHKYNINVITQNIIGVPYETPETFIDTILLNAELDPNASFLSIFYPYPKTELYEVCKKEQFIEDKQMHADFKERTLTVLNMPSFPPDEIHFYFENFQRFIKYQKKRIKNPVLYFLPIRPLTSRLIAHSVRIFERINPRFPYFQH